MALKRSPGTKRAELFEDLSTCVMKDIHFLINRILICSLVGVAVRHCAAGGGSGGCCRLRIVNINEEPQ